MKCKFFEIGLPRTASRSVCEAFHLLGYHVCHGWGEDNVYYSDGVEKLRLGRWDWDLYESCDLAGNVSSVHWYQLQEGVPDARFILAIRPTELWLDSWEGRLHSHAKRLRRSEKQQPSFQVWGRLIHYGMVDFNRGEWGRRYEEHNQKVIETIESERLLVLNVWEMSDEVLWEKLASFVGQSPPNVQFPKLGRREVPGSSKRLKETKQ